MRGSKLIIILLVAYVLLGIVTMKPCLVTGSEWCPNSESDTPGKCYGWDHDCAIRHTLGLEEDIVGNSSKMLVGHLIISWYLGIIILFAALGVSLSIEHLASVTKKTNENAIEKIVNGLSKINASGVLE